jgi:hypothetical protein
MITALFIESIVPVIQCGSMPLCRLQSGQRAVIASGEHLQLRLLDEEVPDIRWWLYRCSSVTQLGTPRSLVYYRRHVRGDKTMPQGAAHAVYERIVLI